MPRIIQKVIVPITSEEGADTRFDLNESFEESGLTDQHYLRYLNMKYSDRAEGFVGFCLNYWDLTTKRQTGDIAHSC